MKKAGLIAVHNPNYGSLLQTYALQKYLNEIGVNNEIIYYKKKTGLKQFLRIFNFQLLVMKGNVVYRDLYSRFFDSTLNRNLRIRVTKFEEFKKNNMQFSDIYVGRKELINATEKYDYFILGSDQVWNPINIGTDYYTLNFISDNKPKITYAPSFGVAKIPPLQTKKTKKYLERIEFVSTREQTGKKIIKDLTGRDVPVVCDPTILVDKHCWDSLKGDTPFIREKYIFCYFLGNRIQIRDFANQFKKETGLKLVALQHLDEFVKDDLSFADIKPYNVGPAEFVNLISNAEYVLTDSFHGTIFSILYKKRFFSFSRHVEKTTNSTNSRIEFLLETLQIPERKLSTHENIKDCLKLQAEYDKAHKILDDFRQQSREYLHNAINSIEDDKYC